MLRPVSTSMPVRIGVVDVSPCALKKQKSNCMTGSLLCCRGWLSERPLFWTHVGHQDL